MIGLTWSSSLQNRAPKTNLMLTSAILSMAGWLDRAGRYVSTWVSRKAVSSLSGGLHFPKRHSEVQTVRDVRHVQCHSKQLELKSYKSPSEPNPLFRPSRCAYDTLGHVDKVFRLCAEKIVELDVSALATAALQSCPFSYKFPSCHDLARRLV